MVEKQPARGRRFKPDNTLEHIDRIGQFDLAIAIDISCIGLISSRRLVRAVDIESDDHLQDGDRVLKIDRLGGQRGTGRFGDAGGRKRPGHGRAAVLCRCCRLRRTGRGHPIVTAASAGSQQAGNGPEQAMMYCV